MEEMNTLNLDFEKGILEINGYRATKPLMLSIPQVDGWNKSKIINMENMPETNRNKPLTDILEIRFYSAKKNIDDIIEYCEGSDGIENGNDLTEEQIAEIEKDMEKRIHRSCVMGEIIGFFALALIVIAIFFPDVLTNICHTISTVTGRIL